jgi:hypothetical protein
MTKHALRHSPHYPEAVYEVERKLIDHMGKSPHLKAAFFTNHDFATKTLDQMAYAINTDGQGKEANSDEPPKIDRSTPFEMPTRHEYACGPQCYCLKFQDAALKAKPSEEFRDDWIDTFANRTKNAAATLVETTAASRRRKAGAT